MPELPEVETIRTSLANEIVGKTIANVEVREAKQFKGDPKELEGKTIASLSRKGKVLTLVFKEALFLSFHLMLTGQILFAPDRKTPVFKNQIPHTGSNTMPVSSTRVIIYFKDNSALYFNDQRKFGWVKVSSTLEETKAVDVLSPHFTFEYFKSAIRTSRKPVKTLLLEQDKVAGIGNIYDNDALWEAKIHPERKANTLSDEELHRLYEGILKVIKEGIQYKGSSAKDEMYVLPNSEKGSYQNHFKVYHQNGKPCPRDGATVERINLNGRGTFFCPKCQV